MKELRIILEDKQYRKLKHIKKSTPYNWRDFILALASVHESKLNEMEVLLENG